MKITKILPLVLALSLSLGCAYADDQSKSAEADYTLTLADYLKITSDTTKTTAGVTYGTDYTSATIDGTLQGKFTVISNNKEQVFYLKGTCPVTGGGGDVQALYGADSSCENVNLVFTNTSSLPETSSVQNITGGAAAKASNPDAIAFAMKITSSHKDGATLTPLTATWDSNKIKYTMKNGVGTFDYSLTGVNISETFSTHDTDGTYQATLMMTESAT